MSCRLRLVAAAFAAALLPLVVSFGIIKRETAEVSATGRVLPKPGVPSRPDPVSATEGVPAEPDPTPRSHDASAPGLVLNEPALTPRPDAIPPINPRTARYLTRRSRLRAPNTERGDRFSDTSFFSTLGLDMNRALSAHAGDGVRDVALLMARLHAQQHPHTAAPYDSRAVACSKARLLVVQFVPESESEARRHRRVLRALAPTRGSRLPVSPGFEGLCSILKTLMLGMGQVGGACRLSCAGGTAPTAAAAAVAPPPPPPLVRRQRGRTAR